MFKKLKENKDWFLIGSVMILTGTVIVLYSRNKVVTDVLLINENELMIEFNNGTANTFVLPRI